jgi:hypothetical protein
MTQRKAVSAGPRILPWLGLILLAGCAASSNSRALFTKPELYLYERHAVLGLDAEQEQLFMAAYLRAFPGKPITFVERGRLREVVNEQDLLLGRLNERSRAKIKNILGVEALIMCEYSPAGQSDPRARKLRVRIVDSETGAIVGSVVVEGAGDFERQARAAAEALESDLRRGDRGKPYSYYDANNPPEGGTGKL